MLTLSSRTRAALVISGLCVILAAAACCAEPMGPTVSANQPPSAALPSLRRADAVEEAIQRNLRGYLPGEEIFVNQGSSLVEHVALTAAPDGKLYLAWVEAGGAEGPSIVVMGSYDGRKWAPPTRLDPGDDPVVDLALAANGKGEVVVAWLNSNACWARRRSAAGEWGRADLVGPGDVACDSSHGSVALTIAPDNLFWLLAVARPSADDRRAPYLWRLDKQGEWVTVTPPPIRSRDRDAEVVLGWREGLVTAAGRSWLRLSNEGTWQPAGALPWDDRPSPALYRERPGSLRTLITGLSRITGFLPPAIPRRPIDLGRLVLWLPPTGEAVVLARHLPPIWPGACLMTSTNLTHWSKPAFLGFLAQPDQLAVAGGPQGLYLATTFDPVPPGRGAGSGTRSSLRVFRLDDRLTRDSDNDGLTDLMEEWLLTDRANRDTDGDGIPDGQDLDPLASSVPDTDEAQIRQAIFTRVTRHQGKAGDAAIIVVVPQRQVFTGHQNIVLCLTEAEAGAYQAKYGAAVGTLRIMNLVIDAARQSATVSWEGSLPGPKAYTGHAKLQKHQGVWVMMPEVG